jgi:hypothetical protein
MIGLETIFAYELVQVLYLRLLIVGSNIGSNINNMQCQLSILMTWHVIN